MKKIILFVICILISLGSLSFALSKVDWDLFLSNVSDFKVRTILLGVGLYLLGFLPRALRWKIMLHEVKPISLSQSARFIILGYATNNLLPFRLGELVRAELSGRETGISRITCLSSIVAERILDGLAIVFYLLVSVWLLFAGLNSIDTDVNRILVLGASIFLGATLGIIGMSFSSRFLTPVITKICGTKIADLVDKYLKALDFFKSFSLVVPVVLLTFLIWGIESSMFIVLLDGLGIDRPVLIGFYCMAIVNLGILVPSAPGFIGVFQAATILAFMSLGLPRESGLAFSVVLHISQFLPITIIGIILLTKMGLGFSSLIQLQKKY